MKRSLRTRRDRLVIGLLVLVAPALFGSLPPGLTAQSSSIEVLPEHSEATKRALHLLDRDSVSQAIRVLEESVEIGPAHPNALVVLAAAYGRATEEASLFKKRGLAGKQRDALIQALRLDPAHIDARSELADFYFYAPGIVGGSRTKAEEQLGLLSAVSELAEHRARARHALSDDEFAKAAEHLAVVTSTAPGDAEEHYLLGALLVRLDRPETAIEAFVLAVRADPGHARAHYQVGRLAALLGVELEPGIESLTRFLGLGGAYGIVEPKHAHWRLGQIYVRLGDLTTARTHFESALALDPSFEEARNELQAINESSP